jgi:hypothetical protein
MPEKIPTVIKGGFRKRSLPMSVDYRPMYKIGLIALILDMAGSGGKSSLNKLHFFVWSLKSLKNREYIRQIIDSNRTEDIVSWGVEPALNKALLFGVAEGLLQLQTGRYALTEMGKQFARTIQQDKTLFVSEKQFLAAIGKRTVTEKFMNDLTQKISS